MHKKNYYTQNNKIQIISGKWKGRYIYLDNRISIRPTLSRIRETLFNWIDPVITNAKCLDCFTGSGSLGLESLSRGANTVTFIDQNLTCVVKLIKCIHAFQAHNNSEIIHSDCRHWIQQSRNVYDIIFIDPPFHNYTIISEIIFLLEKHNQFKPKSWIYIETSNHQKSIFTTKKLPKFWSLYRKKVTKNNLYLLYLRYVQNT